MKTFSFVKTGSDAMRKAGKLTKRILSGSEWRERELLKRQLENSRKRAERAEVVQAQRRAIAGRLKAGVEAARERAAEGARAYTQGYARSMTLTASRCQKEAAAAKAEALGEDSDLAARDRANIGAARAAMMTDRAAEACERAYQRRIAAEAAYERRRLAEEESERRCAEAREKRREAAVLVERAFQKQLRERVRARRMPGWRHAMADQEIGVLDSVILKVLEAPTKRRLARAGANLFEALATGRVGGVGVPRNGRTSLVPLFLLMCLSLVAMTCAAPAATDRPVVYHRGFDNPVEVDVCDSVRSGSGPFALKVVGNTSDVVLDIMYLTMDNSGDKKKVQACDVRGVARPKGIGCPPGTRVYELLDRRVERYTIATRRDCEGARRQKLLEFRHDISVLTSAKVTTSKTLTVRLFDHPLAKQMRVASHCVPVGSAECLGGSSRCCGYGHTPIDLIDDVKPWLKIALYVLISTTLFMVTRSKFLVVVSVLASPVVTLLAVSTCTGVHVPIGATGGDNFVTYLRPGQCLNLEHDGHTVAGLTYKGSKGEVGTDFYSMLLEEPRLDIDALYNCMYPWNDGRPFKRKTCGDDPDTFCKVDNSYHYSGGVATWGGKCALVGQMLCSCKVTLEAPLQARDVAVEYRLTEPKHYNHMFSIGIGKKFVHDDTLEWMIKTPMINATVSVVVMRTETSIPWGALVRPDGRKDIRIMNRPLADDNVPHASELTDKTDVFQNTRALSVAFKQNDFDTCKAEVVAGLTALYDGNSVKAPGPFTTLSVNVTGQFPRQVVVATTYATKVLVRVDVKKLDIAPEVCKTKCEYGKAHPAGYAEHSVYVLVYKCPGCDPLFKVTGGAWLVRADNGTMVVACDSCGVATISDSSGGTAKLDLKTLTTASYWKRVRKAISTVSESAVVKIRGFGTGWWDWAKGLFNFGGWFRKVKIALFCAAGFFVGHLLGGPITGILSAAAVALAFLLQGSFGAMAFAAVDAVAVSAGVLFIVGGWLGGCLPMLIGGVVYEVVSMGCPLALFEVLCVAAGCLAMSALLATVMYYAQGEYYWLDYLDIYFEMLALSVAVVGELLTRAALSIHEALGVRKKARKKRSFNAGLLHELAKGVPEATAAALTSVDYETAEIKREMSPAKAVPLNVGLVCLVLAKAICVVWSYFEFFCFVVSFGRQEEIPWGTTSRDKVVWGMATFWCYSATGALTRVRGLRASSVALLRAGAFFGVAICVLCLPPLVLAAAALRVVRALARRGMIPDRVMRACVDYNSLFVGVVDSLVDEQIVMDRLEGSLRYTSLLSSVWGGLEGVRSRFFGDSCMHVAAMSAVSESSELNAVTVNDEGQLYFPRPTICALADYEGGTETKAFAYGNGGGLVAPKHYVGSNSICIHVNGKRTVVRQCKVDGVDRTVYGEALDVAMRMPREGEVCRVYNPLTNTQLTLTAHVSKTERGKVWFTGSTNTDPLAGWSGLPILSEQAGDAVGIYSAHVRGNDGRWLTVCFPAGKGEVSGVARCFDFSKSRINRCHMGVGRGKTMGLISEAYSQRTGVIVLQPTRALVNNCVNGAKVLNGLNLGVGMKDHFRFTGRVDVWTYGYFAARVLSGRAPRASLIIADEYHSSDPNVRWACTWLESKATCQVIFSSASPEGVPVQDGGTKYAVETKVVDHKAGNDTVEADWFRVSGVEVRFDELMKDEQGCSTTLIFVATKRQATDVAEKFKAKKYSAIAVTSKNVADSPWLQMGSGGFIVATNCLESGVTLDVINVVDTCSVNRVRQGVDGDIQTIGVTTRAETYQRCGRVGRKSVGKVFVKKVEHEAWGPDQVDLAPYYALCKATETDPSFGTPEAGIKDKIDKTELSILREALLGRVEAPLMAKMKFVAADGRSVHQESSFTVFRGSLPRSNFDVVATDGAAVYRSECSLDTKARVVYTSASSSWISLVAGVVIAAVVPRLYGAARHCIAEPKYVTEQWVVPCMDEITAAPSQRVQRYMSDNVVYCLSSWNPYDFFGGCLDAVRIFLGNRANATQHWFLTKQASASQNAHALREAGSTVLAAVGFGFAPHMTNMYAEQRRVTIDQGVSEGVEYLNGFSNSVIQKLRSLWAEKGVDVVKAMGEWSLHQKLALLAALSLTQVKQTTGIHGQVRDAVAGVGYGACMRYASVNSPTCAALGLAGILYMGYYRQRPCFSVSAVAAWTCPVPNLGEINWNPCPFEAFGGKTATVVDTMQGFAVGYAATAAFMNAKTIQMIRNLQFTSVQEKTIGGAVGCVVNLCFSQAGPGIVAGGMFAYVVHRDEQQGELDSVRKRAKWLMRDVNTDALTVQSDDLFGTAKGRMDALARGVPNFVCAAIYAATCPAVAVSCCVPSMALSSNWTEFSQTMGMMVPAAVVAARNVKYVGIPAAAGLAVAPVLLGIGSKAAGLSLVAAYHAVALRDEPRVVFTSADDPQVCTAQIAEGPAWSERQEQMGSRLAVVGHVRPLKCFSDDVLYKSRVMSQFETVFGYQVGDNIGLASRTKEAYLRTMKERIDRPRAVVNRAVLEEFRGALEGVMEREVKTDPFTVEEVADYINRRGALGTQTNSLTGNYGRWYDALTDADRAAANLFDEDWQNDNGMNRPYYSMMAKQEKRVVKGKGTLFPAPRMITYPDERTRLLSMMLLEPIIAKHVQRRLFWGSNMGRPIWHVGRFLNDRRAALEKANGTPYVFVCQDVKWWDTSIEAPLLDSLGPVWSRYTTRPELMEKFVRMNLEPTVVSATGEVMTRTGQVSSGWICTSLWNGHLNSALLALITSKCGGVPVSDVVDLCDAAIEGDDSVVIMPASWAAKFEDEGRIILSSLGMVLKGGVTVVQDIEEVDFCSHNFVSLGQNGDFAPMRDIRGLMERLTADTQYRGAAEDVWHARQLAMSYAMLYCGSRRIRTFCEAFLERTGGDVVRIEEVSYLLRDYKGAEISVSGFVNDVYGGRVTASDRIAISAEKRYLDRGTGFFGPHMTEADVRRRVVSATMPFSEVSMEDDVLVQRGENDAAAFASALASAASVNHGVGDVVLLGCRRHVAKNVLAAAGLRVRDSGSRCVYVVECIQDFDLGLAYNRSTAVNISVVCKLWDWGSLSRFGMRPVFVHRDTQGGGLWCHAIKSVKPRVSG